MIPLRRNRDFLLMWGGQSLSELGSQLSLVAYPLLVLALTGSAAKAGIAAFAKTLPIALLALPAGALADRVDRRRLMVASDAARAVALAALVAAVALGRVPYPLIAVVAFVDGAGFIVSYVAERGVLRRLVAREQVPEALARNESRTFAARLAGPPLGGVLFALGRAVPFLVDAVSYAASTAALLLIRADFQEERVPAERGGVTDGVRWLWRRPFFRGCALLFAAGNPVFAGLELLIIVLARRQGASAGLIGAMLAVVAAGGMVGALLAPRLQRLLSPRVALAVDGLLIAAAMPFLLVAHQALLLGLVAAVAELPTPTTNAIVTGRRIALTPDRLQGRVQAAGGLVSMSAAWAGPLITGLLLEHVSTTATILVFVGWTAFLALVALSLPALRRPPDPACAGAPRS